MLFAKARIASRAEHCTHQAKQWADFCAAKYAAEFKAKFFRLPFASEDWRPIMTGATAFCAFRHCEALCKVEHARLFRDFTIIGLDYFGHRYTAAYLECMNEFRETRLRQEFFPIIGAWIYDQIHDELPESTEEDLLACIILGQMAHDGGLDVFRNVWGL